uniref:Alkaline phosphatase n=1 Tax=Nyssomyia neivai TaxID=330878 RepID=A0A1L8DKL6_9DIPT
MPSDGLKAVQGASDPELTKDYWINAAKLFVENQVKRPQNLKKAKNVIFFLGDGMGITTVTASRMLLGGEEEQLSFERFPFTGSAMTYCVNRKVPDSACTATAYLMGVKNNYGTIGVNANVPRDNCLAGQDEGTFTVSIADLAQRMGKATGLVTTTRVTHASPAGLFAHIAERDWEADANINRSGCNASEIDDIALQLIHGDVGKKFNVILGGGRRQFRDTVTRDEEGSLGQRTDGRDLIEEWLDDSGKINQEYVWNREQLLNLNTSKTDHLLGLFESSHMLYHLETIARQKEDTEPTLAEMTQKALEILRKNDEGFFLFVEGGRIDMAHHDLYTRTSLDETVEFHKAIELARNMFSEEDTLIVVSADHSHVVSMSGYPDRKQNIFGYGGNADDNKPYFTMSYANGPGFGTHVVEGEGRVDPRSLDTTAWNFRFPAMVPLDSETHAGEDVPVYASGPWGHLFTGTYEQNVIPHLIAYAADMKGDGWLLRNSK